jgi:hypothetical protein
MMMLRIIWYIFCVGKVLSIAFFSKPKLTVRERVYRKYLASHAELLKSFNDDDKRNMEVILDNTIKNAAARQEISDSRLRKSTKRVNFETEKNDYYEPKELNDPVVFFDVAPNPPPSMHLDQSASFEEKKHEEEFIEREDLLDLEAKTEEMPDAAESPNLSSDETVPLVTDSGSPA